MIFFSLTSARRGLVIRPYYDDDVTMNSIGFFSVFFYVHYLSRMVPPQIAFLLLLGN